VRSIFVVCTQKSTPVSRKWQNTFNEMSNWISNVFAIVANVTVLKMFIAYLLKTSIGNTIYCYNYFLDTIKTTMSIKFVGT